MTIGNIIRNIAVISAVCMLSVLPCVRSSADTPVNPDTSKTDDVAKAGDNTTLAGAFTTAPSVPAAAVEQDLKVIQQKKEAAEESLQQKQQELQKGITEADKAGAEKQALEMQAKAKEQEAAIKKQEVKALKKEAEVTNGSETIKKAKKLTAEAEKLEKEAEVYNEKLKAAELKEQKANAEITANHAEIEKLKKILEEVKRERLVKRSPLEKAMVSVAIILAGLALFFILRAITRKLESFVARKKDVIREDAATLRMRTFIKLFSWLGNILVIIVVFYLMLESVGFSVAPLIAGAGIIGLAFGFGGQYLIRDLINGLFILLEGQYSIDDVVKIGDQSGLVENVNLRITTLRDLEGRVIVIPNGEVKTVINYTKDFAYALLDIGVAYKENIDRVIDIIKETGADMRKDAYFNRIILEDLEMLGVDDFGDSQVTIKFRIKTLPIKQWEVAREFRRRIKNRFDELGIEIPFPHRTVYFGTGKDNEWVKDLFRGK